MTRNRMEAIAVAALVAGLLVARIFFVPHSQGGCVTTMPAGSYRPCNS
jgi:hypothetical protein